MKKGAIEKIQRSLHLRVLASGGILTLLFYALGHANWILSVWLGIGFSGLIFRSLAKQNSTMAQNGKSRIGQFLGLMIRLGLYAAPLSLTFSFPAYLNIFVVLLCLLTYQAHYILFELNYFWQHYKNRLKRKSMN